MQEIVEKEKKLSELFTQNQVTLRFVSEFVKRFKDGSDDEPIKISNTPSGNEVLYSDNRFYGVMTKGKFGKKIHFRFSLSSIYELCLTFKHAGIKLSDVMMCISNEHFPSLFKNERIPFDVLLAPSEVADPFEDEEDEDWDESENQSLTTKEEK